MPPGLAVAHVEQELEPLLGELFVRPWRLLFVSLAERPQQRRTVALDGTHFCPPP